MQLPFSLTLGLAPFFPHTILGLYFKLHNVLPTLHRCHQPPPKKDFKLHCTSSTNPIFFQSYCIQNNINVMGFIVPCLSLFTLALLPFPFIFIIPSSQITLGNSPTSVNPSPMNTAPPLGGYGLTDLNSSVSSYYYLLIAVFLTILIILTLVLIRRRRILNQRLRERRTIPQVTPRMPPERWHRIFTLETLGLEPRIEGLNERGEAPPPYMPGQPPSAVHINGGPSAVGDPLPLQTLGKPPDYYVIPSEYGWCLTPLDPLQIHGPVHTSNSSRRYFPTPVREDGPSQPGRAGGEQEDTSVANATVAHEAVQNHTNEEVDSPTAGNGTSGERKIAPPVVAIMSLSEAHPGPVRNIAERITRLGLGIGR